MRGIGTVGWVCYEDTDRCEQSGGECAEDRASESIDCEKMLGEADGIERVDQMWEQQKAKA